MTSENEHSAIASTVLCSGCNQPPHFDENGDPIDLLICSRCRQASYHDVNCQKKHYKIHKKTCRSSPKSKGNTTAITTTVETKKSILEENYIQSLSKTYDNSDGSNVTVNKSIEDNYIKNAKESLHSKLKKFIDNARSQQCGENKKKTWSEWLQGMRGISLNDANTLKSFVYNEATGDENEQDRRLEGVKKIYHETIHEIFAHARWSSERNSASDGCISKDSLFLIHEVSKLLKQLINQYTILSDRSNGEMVSLLEECLDGSLLVKEKPVDLIGCEGMIWPVSGYEGSSFIMEHLEESTPGNVYAKIKQDQDRSIDACQKNRITSPKGASMLSRFNESTDLIDSLGGGCFREAWCAVSAFEFAFDGIHVDGDLLGLAGGSGIRCEQPLFAVVKMKQNSQNRALAIEKRYTNFTLLNDGFYDPGIHVTCSKEHSLIACMAERKRIKIFDTSKSGMPCRATLRAPECWKVFFMGDNIVTVSSFGKNVIHKWKIQDLKEHVPLTLKDAHKKALSRGEWLDLEYSSYNVNIMEDPSAIDVNIGQSAHVKSHIQGLPAGFDFDSAAKNEASMNHSLILGSNDDPALYMIDLEQSKVTNGLLGHHNNRRIQIKTSKEMQNLVMSTQYDNKARIWDLRIRSNVPVLTLNHGYNTAMNGEITSCFAEDMFAFTAGEDQCIRAWDLRAPVCLYKLSTGNTVARDLHYSQQTQSLFAAVHGIDYKQFFPPKFFPHEWNAYTQKSKIVMQHGNECSHLLVYDFKESLDVNVTLPLNQPKEDSSSMFNRF